MQLIDILRQYNKLIALATASVVITAVGIGFVGAPHCENIDLDCSWTLDGLSKLQRGELAGRDFFFTYGIGGQLLYGLTLLLRPGESVGNMIPLLKVGPYVLNLFLLVTCLALIPFATWRISLIIIFIFSVSIDPALSMRPLISVLAIILVARALESHENWKQNILCLCAGITIFSGQLITFDIGIYATVATTGLIVAAIFIHLLGSTFFLPHR
jgi:hypothetical protein